MCGDKRGKAESGEKSEEAHFDRGSTRWRWGSRRNGEREGTEYRGWNNGLSEKSGTRMVERDEKETNVNGRDAGTEADQMQMRLLKRVTRSISRGKRDGKVNIRIWYTWP